MNCPRCEKKVSEENQFCGNCGEPVTTDNGQLEAKFDKSIQERIDRAIDDRYQTRANHELVDLRATEEVINRAWRWLTRLSFIIGVPIGVVGLALAIVGVNSVASLYELRAKAVEELQNIKNNAKDMKEVASTKKEEFDKGIAELEEKGKQVSIALTQATKLRNSLEDIKIYYDKYKNAEELFDRRFQAADKTAEAEGEENTRRKLKLASDAIEFDENYARAYYVRGQAHYALGKNNYDDALADYKKYIKRRKKDYRGYHEIGVVYQMKGEHGKAIRAFNEAIKYDRRSFKTFRRRGWSEYIENNYSKSADDFDNATKHEVVNGHNLIWQFLSKARKPSANIADLVQILKNDIKALDLSEDWPRPILKFYSRQMKIDELKRKSRAAKNYNCEYLFYVGQYYFNTRNKDEARLFLKKAMENCQKSSIEYTIAKRDLESEQ